MIFWDAFVALMRALLRLFTETTHNFVNVCVEPLKVLMPVEVEFYRPDNGPDGFTLFKKDSKPLGYWVGHVVAYVIIGVVIYRIFGG